MRKEPVITADLPATRQEMSALGWSRADVILVSGDAFIDSPYIGVAVIARVLLDAGYRVALIAQPDIHNDRDITRLGEPALFWGVTGGCMDSMVANYTATGKPRRSDDLTPGGRNTRRPDRTVIVYSNLIRRHFKQTVPIVLGGIEASLRRISHYDAWSGRVRRSILFDAKADLLLYGMAETSIVEVARAIEDKHDVRGIRGVCYISPALPGPVDVFSGPDIALPAHAEVVKEKEMFAEMFRTFYANIHPQTARRLYQQQDTRYLVHNPPSFPLSVEELDAVYERPYTRQGHPREKDQGSIRALETIRFGLTTHRGCYGECRFCAIAVHQGTQVVSRSMNSLLREAASFRSHPDFKGIISDVGGPTANMYAIECSRKQRKGPCRDKGCLFPEPCPKLPIRHRAQMDLLSRLRALPGIRKVFIGSGLRHDMIAGDRRDGMAYLEQILKYHISGQLKIAPEHVQENVLNLMGKPGRDILEGFHGMFYKLNQRQTQKTFLTYYLLADHPGCTLADMKALREYALRRLRMLPEQVQIFTPTPSTFSTLMYHTQRDPFSGKTLFVEKNVGGKQKQKDALKRTKQKHRFTKDKRSKR
ncbi:MAG: YgiQ family radical SAM protein [Desulfobacteraceae bacterium]|nr:YgiQ family radical SAM protein [Desulfobacteraceae bacterium]